MQLGNLLGAILQPLYFSLFIIFTKQIKNKRVLFISLMILEHIILKYACNLNYNVNFELTYTIIYFLILKILYKNKARVTDIVTFVLAIILLGIISVIVSVTAGMNILGLLLSAIIPILIIFLFKHKLASIERFYNKFWNRHSNAKMLKSITIRGFSSALTIIIFILIHLWLIYGIYIVRR